MISKFATVLLLLSLAACGDDHGGVPIVEYKGDYRFDGNIGEFFDCEERRKYYISTSGAHDALKEKYQALGLKDKDDAYAIVEGYVTKESMMEGIDPVSVFVASRIVSIDKNRGCQKGHIREGR